LAHTTKYCESFGSHGTDYEEHYLLGCYSEYSLVDVIPVFQRNVLLPSSGSKSMGNKKQPELFVPNSATLTMEAVNSSETLVNIRLHEVTSLQSKVLFVSTLSTSSPSSSTAKQPFLSHSLPQKFVRFDLVFTSLDFVTIIFFYRARSSALRPNSQRGGPGLCIYVPSGRMAQLYPQAPSSLFVTFYDL
jgi:hypothetical protein